MSTLLEHPASKRIAPKRVPELDGLRAFAILPVIFHHSAPQFGWVGFFGEAGWMGVDLFFVLSGYLITGILLKTVGDPHYYRNFVIRRTLRIFPLYYLCLALFTTAAYLSGGPQWLDMQKWGIGWLVTYLGNVRAAWMHSLPPIFSFALLWSLQVEEQFYLLYPFVVLRLSRQNLRRFLIGCVVVAPLLRTFLVLSADNPTASYVLMPCRMDALALGGLVAILAQSPSARWPTRTQLRWGVIIIGAAALGLYAFVWQAEPLGTQSHPWMASLGYSLNAMAFAALLTTIVLSPSPGLSALLSWRPFTYTGTIAYGLYLLHGPASWIARKLVMSMFGIDVPGHSAASVAITFPVSFLVAGLCWRYFESPILMLKDRFTPPTPRPPAIISDRGPA